MAKRRVAENTAGKRTFVSGQEVAFDGLYTNEWGGRLPLMRGDLFPVHPEMGVCRWTYQGPVGAGLPNVRFTAPRRQYR